MFIKLLKNAAKIDRLSACEWEQEVLIKSGKSFKVIEIKNTTDENGDPLKIIKMTED